MCVYACFRFLRFALYVCVFFYFIPFSFCTRQNELTFRMEQLAQCVIEWMYVPPFRSICYFCFFFYFSLAFCILCIPSVLFFFLASHALYLRTLHFYITYKLFFFLRFFFVFKYVCIETNVMNTQIQIYNGDNESGNMKMEITRI